MKKENVWKALLVGVLTGGVLVIFLAWACKALIYPYGNDSITYIEQARNYLAGKGFISTPFGLSDLDSNAIPNKAFPPGYPSAIAIVSSLGIAPNQAALVVSRCSWALVGTAVTFALSPLLGNALAAALGVSTIVSPGVFHSGYLALSDAPFLVLTILSIGLLLRSYDAQARSWVVLWSGVLAGAAYLTRNAALAIFAAVLGAYVAAMITGLFSRREAIRQAGLWFAGAATGVVPLIVRNLLVFGNVQPYFDSGVSSSFTLVRSIRNYVWSMLLDLTGSRSVADSAWDWRFFLLIGLPMVCLLVYGLVRFYRESDSPVRWGLLVGGSYLVAGSGMVILGRTSFDWVESNLLRHVIQYSWLVLAAVIIGLRGLPISEHSYLGGVTILIVALFFGRGMYLVEFVQGEQTIKRAFAENTDLYKAVLAVPNKGWPLTNQLFSRFASDHGIQQHVRGLPEDALVVSNYGKLLSFTTGRSIRQLPLKDAAGHGCEERLVRAGEKITKQRDLFWVILPTNPMIREGDPSTWQDGLVKSCSGLFSVFAREQSLLVLQYQGNGNPSK